MSSGKLFQTAGAACVKARSQRPRLVYDHRVDILSRTVSELSQLIFQILDTAYLSHSSGDSGATYDFHLRLI